MNSANSRTAQCSATAAARPVDDAAVVCGADMPDVVRPGPADGHHSASNVNTTASRCLTCRYHAPLYDSSSSSSSSSSAAAAAAANHQVIYAGRDSDNAASERRVREPLPDLVNVHKQPASSSYDRQQPTSVIYHATAAAVNHYMPQPPASALRSPTGRFIRGLGGRSKLGCCERSVTRCMLSAAALRWSMLILVSLGLACIVIGIILGVLQVTSGGVQRDTNSLVHSVVLMGLGAALVAVVAVIWKCVLATPERGLRSEPCRLLEELNDSVTRPRSGSSALHSTRRVQTTTRTGRFGHCDYAYWSAGAGSPEIQRQSPPSYSASLNDYESTHGTCRVSGRHCSDLSSPPLVERSAPARRLCVAALPGRSTCRLYVANESAQCRMMPCAAGMCRHNCCEGSLQR